MDKVLLDYGFGERGFGLYIRQFNKYQKQKLVAFIPERNKEINQKGNSIKKAAPLSTASKIIKHSKLLIINNKAKTNHGKRICNSSR